MLCTIARNPQKNVLLIHIVYFCCGENKIRIRSRVGRRHAECLRMQVGSYSDATGTSIVCKALFIPLVMSLPTQRHYFQQHPMWRFLVVISTFQRNDAIYYYSCYRSLSSLRTHRIILRKKLIYNTFREDHGLPRLKDTS